MILIHIAWILALAVILSALQPAAFGEHFYRITPYLMIGSGLPAGSSGGRQQFFHQRIGHVPVTLPADPVPDLP